MYFSSFIFYFITFFPSSFVTNITTTQIKNIPSTLSCFGTMQSACIPAPVIWLILFLLVEYDGCPVTLQPTGKLYCICIRCRWVARRCGTNGSVGHFLGEWWIKRNGKKGTSLKRTACIVIAVAIRKGKTLSWKIKKSRQKNKESFS